MSKRIERSYAPVTVERWRYAYEQSRTRTHASIGAELGVSARAVGEMCKQYCDYLNLLEAQRELKELRDE